jgi:hypothetical protein
LVEDKDVKLPDGTKVESGLEFRNTFHLQGDRISAAFFVPCGGRPAAVSADNWQVCVWVAWRRMAGLPKIFISNAGVSVRQPAPPALPVHCGGRQSVFHARCAPQAGGSWRGGHQGRQVREGK